MRARTLPLRSTHILKGLKNIKDLTDLKDLKDLKRAQEGAGGLELSGRGAVFDGPKRQVQLVVVQGVRLCQEFSKSK